MDDELFVDAWCYRKSLNRELPNAPVANMKSDWNGARDAPGASWHS
jgi:hypothetical protein